MRLLNLLLLGAAAIANAASTTDSSDATPETTTFNQKTVPAMLELTPDNWDTEFKASKGLMVKYYSPYCPHCTTFAPTYQTLYEFYYTSAPGGSENQEADFTKFYDFRFATVNCVAYYDLCAKNGVKKYPTTILYKDGQDVATIEAVKKLADLSAIVEPVLEQLKPGTRPKELQLPNAGDSSVPGAASASTGLAKDAEPEKADSAATGAAAGTAAAAAAKTAAVWVPPVPTYEPAQPAKPAVTPNQEGKSVALSGENFQKRVTLTQSPWLVKFYAPWCQHCQAMAPDWEQLAKEMQGKLNIGEVNCDASPRLCKDAKVKGYPTIMFFKGGQRIEYDGLRGLGDLMQYADKAIDLSGGVPEVDMEAFKELEKKEKVIFVYFYDHATTTEDFLALERLPLPLIGRAKLVKTKDPKMAEHFKISTWPRLLVSREGRPTYYAPLTPDKMRNKDKVLKWMRSVWLPILPEMTASNAREIMDGKIVVLGILNRDDADGFKRAQREMRSAANEWMDKQIHMLQIERQELRDAKQLRIEEAEDRGDTRALRAAKAIKINMDKTDRKQVIFAWVDGVFWQRWIRTTYGIDVKDGERVIINDEDNRRYWDKTITGNFIVPSRTSILETINKVTSNPPKIKPKLTISKFEKTYIDVKATFHDHPYLTMGCIFGILFGLASWFRGRIRRTAGGNRGHFRLEDATEVFKAPLLGVSSSNGAKTD